MSFLESVKELTGDDPMQRGYYRFQTSHGPDLCFVPGYHNNIESVAVFLDHGYDDEFDGDPHFIFAVTPMLTLLTVITSVMNEKEGDDGQAV